MSDTTYRRGGQPLVDSLLKLAVTSDTNPSARAALAELRRGVTDPIRAAKHVIPYLPATGAGSAEHLIDRYFLVASLFAWSRQHQPGVSMGHAFARIRDDSGSMEKRLMALLATPAETLGARLGQCVRLLAGKGVGLDWTMLLDDVLHWDDSGKPRQRRLARDFYRRHDAVDDAGAEASANPTKEGIEQP